MFESSDVAYLKPSGFNKISLMLGICYGLCFNCLFVLIKSFIKDTRFVLVLGFVKDGAPHFGLLTLSGNPSSNKRSTSF